MKCKICGNDIPKGSKSCNVCDASTTPPPYLNPFSLPIGYKLRKRYAIVKVLKQDTFCISYKAFDLKEKKKIVIKEMFVDGSARDTINGTLNVVPPTDYTLSEYLLLKKDFESQGKILKSLNNKYIVKTYGIFKDKNTVYVVMENIEGKTLRKYVNDSDGLETNEVIKILNELCKGLKAIHKIGYIHKSINPNNIIITKSGIKMGDFLHLDLKDSESGAILKSPKHYAPQKDNEPSLPSYDIYSVGKLVYYMLTKKTLKISKSIGIEDLLSQRENPDDIPMTSLSISDIFKKDPLSQIKDKDLSNIIRKASREEWEERYQNCDELMREFENGKLKWKYKINGSIEYTPALGKDGTIYVGSKKGYLYAIDSDGKLKWKSKISGSIDSNLVIDSEGTIYLTSSKHYLYAINSDGSLKWGGEIKEEIISEPSIGKFKTAYLTTKEGYLYAINPDGDVNWKYKVSEKIVTGPVIDSKEVIYVGSERDYLYAINGLGEMLWKSKIEYGILSKLVVGKDGNIYVKSKNAGYSVIDTEGNFLWSGTIDEKGLYDFIIDFDGSIYIRSDKRMLYAINPDRSLKWTYKDKNIIASDLAISSDKTIYMGTDDGSLHAINVGGVLRWEYKGNIQFSSKASPVIDSKGVVYVGSKDGYIHAIQSNIRESHDPWPTYGHDARHTGCRE